MPPRTPDLAPTRADVLPAVRVAVSVVVPLVLVAALGRLDLSLYAVFGALTSVYGRQGTHVDRALMQLSAAVALVGSVVLGTALGALTGSAWVVVPATALAAVLGSVTSDVRRWRPPGSLFPVFAAGACAGHHAGGPSVLVALVVSASAAVFALLLGAGGALLPRTRRVGRTMSRRRPPPGVARNAAAHAGAAAVASALAVAWGSPHAYWAAVAAVVPLGLADTRDRLRRAWQRFAGTAIGLGLAAVLLALHPGEWATVALVALLQLLTELFVLRRYAVAMVFVTPLALLMTALGSGSTDGLVLDRAATTAMGVVVGIAVVLMQHDRSSEW